MTTVYTFFYALEISSETLKAAIIFYKLEYLGISFISTFFLFFVLDYSGRMTGISKKITHSLLIIPILTVILVFSNELHHLYFLFPNLNQGLFYSHLNFKPGPWYWIYNIYSVLILLYSLYMIGRMWITTASVYRKQVSIIFYGTSLPSLAYLIYVSGFFEKGLDPIPFAFFISTIIIYYVD